ncbi:MAG: imidazole glycerol phosphate synthase subunit HisH [Gemmatimonadaceae bacterium]|nr:imidazole glycerol phosphate synthase subunit HisH [Gemmatimonadaceae bacterium]
MTVFDYEAGNLHSLLKALDDPALGVRVRVETDARALLRDTDLLVLPGVGAFGHAAARLAPGRTDVAAALRDGLPALGICLGLQLLCEASDEGAGDGLGVVPGRVRLLRARRVPQIGWNRVEWTAAEGAPSATLPQLPIAYYANSYVAAIDGNDPCVLATSTHETDRFAAVVRVARTVGAQFHPEKSSAAGVAFVRAVVADAVGAVVDA